MVLAYKRIRNQINNLKIMCINLEELLDKQDDEENKTRLKLLIKDLTDAREILKDAEIKARQGESWIGEINVR